MANKKKRPASEPDVSYMEYLDPAGRVARVDRLDMSDEEWAKTKQTAIDKGVFKFAHDREVPKAETETSPLQDGKTYQNPLGEKKAAASVETKAPDRDLNEMVEVSDAKGNKYTVRRADVGKLDPKKLEEQNKNVVDGREGTGTLGGKLKSVAAKLFGGAIPSDQGEALAASVELPKTPAAKPGSNASMRAVASKEMAAEAAAAPPEVSQQVVNGPQVTPRPESMAGAVVPPAEPSVLQKMNVFDPNSQINQTVGEMIGTREPLKPAAPEGPMLVDPPPPSANKMAPTAGANVPAQPPAPTGSSSVKVSASSKGVPDPSMPPLVDRRAEFEKNAATLNEMKLKNAETEAAGITAEADVLRKGLKEATDLEVERRLAEKVAQDHVREAQAAYTKTVEEMKAPEKIDPDRWWNSRSTAKKIFAVLSAGLTRGATLGMFQDAIARDIQAQQHDISNARIARAQRADAQHNVYQMARQNGLDERAAYLTAESHAWDNIERASKLAAMTAKAPSVIAAAQEQAALANQQKTEKLTHLDALLETQGMERKKLFLENKKLDILAMKKTGSSAPKPGKALEPGMKARLIDAKDGLSAVQQMKKILGGESSVVGAAKDEVSKRVPIFKTDAKDRQKAIEPLRRKLLRLIDNSAVMKADADFWKGKISEVGFANISHADLDALAANFQQEYDNTLETNRQAGANVAGFAPGAQPVPSEEDALNALLAQE